MSKYPRTYQATRWWKLFLLGGALLLGIPSVIGLAYCLTGQVTNDKGQMYWLAGSCLFLLALSAYILLSTLRSQVVLFAEHIEIHELTTTKRMHRGEISGWRLAASSFIIELKHPPGQIISTAWIYTWDSEMDDWFSQLDNLDDKEMESFLDEIADNNELGAEEQERFQKLQSVARLTRVLNIVGGGLLAWAVFFPRPYTLVVLLLLLAPWLAALVAWRSAGLISSDESSNNLKPNLAVFWLAPMIALSLRAILDYQTLGWVTQTVAAVFIGSSLFSAQLAAYPDLRANRPRAALTLAFALLAYGYGATIEINALADTSDIQQTRYLLRAKSISSGKVTTHNADLEKVDPLSPTVESARVTEYFYKMLKPGDSVCLAFRPGALGIKWFSAGPCPPGTP